MKKVSRQDDAWWKKNLDLQNLVLLQTFYLLSLQKCLWRNFATIFSEISRNNCYEISRNKFLFSINFVFREIKKSTFLSTLPISKRQVICVEPKNLILVGIYGFQFSLLLKW
jgi:hypothetical protein